MKQKRIPAVSISTLVGGILLVLAFTRGTLSHVLLVLFVALWCVAVGFQKLRPPNSGHRQSTPQNTAATPAEKKLSRLLLQQVEARISEQLRAMYPQANWRWYTDDPEDAIVKGRTAWIKTSHTGDYDMATMDLGDPASLKLELVQTRPVRRTEQPNAEPAQMQTESGTAQAAEAAPQASAETALDAAATALEETDNDWATHLSPEPEKTASNVDVWYQIIGHPRLVEIITELNISGIHQITINADGQITDADGKLGAESSLENMPSPDTWQELAQLLAEDDLKTSFDETNFTITW